MREKRTAATFTAAVIALFALSGCSGQPSAPAATDPAPSTTVSATTLPATTLPATTAPATATRAGPEARPVQRCAAETGSWNTLPESAPVLTQSALYNSRIGKHDCYDRVVFDINGPGPVGYDVRYVPVVTADGSGKPLPVAGGAALQVVVRAPAQGTPGDTSGHQPGVIFAPSGTRLHGPGGLENWGCLREVRSAGSFEGQTTFAVGVRRQLPFSVGTWTDSNQTTHVTVDIAH